MKTAVIFDMDGVIIDSEPVYMDRLANYLNYRNCKFERADLYKIVGSSDKETWKIVASLFDNSRDFNEVKRDYKEYIKDKPKVEYIKILNKDFIPLADYLKSQNILLALASSSPLYNIKQVLEECKIEEYFDVIVSGEQFTKSKPDPAIYNYAANALNCPKDQILAIEDSTYGIMAARSADIECLALKDNRYNFRQDLANTIIDSLLEVKNYIR